MIRLFSIYSFSHKFVGVHGLEVYWDKGVMVEDMRV